MDGEFFRPARQKIAGILCVFQDFLRACLESQRVRIGEGIFCQSRREAEGILGVLFPNLKFGNNAFDLSRFAVAAVYSGSRKTWHILLPPFQGRVKFCVNWSDFAASERNYTKFYAVFQVF